MLAAGCVRTTPLVAPPMQTWQAPWVFNGQPARIIKTEHYRIHTTITEPEVLESLTRIMEGSLAHFRELTPDVKLTERPMDCYIFARRQEWAQFTRDHTGSDAAVYLQINRGGYTVRDWFVAYYIGDVGTYAVAAHEGWHQYVARHFKSRLPPFMEEGIATMYENISWRTGSPRWDLLSNPSRSERLRSAIRDHQLWPLEQLCMMHAGDVVSLSGERIETFYAQNWAFGQFMLHGENGRFRPALQRMLRELASGEADVHMGRRRGAGDGWDPQSVRPLLEYYLQMDIDQINMYYQAFIRRLATDGRNQRFG